MLHEIALLMGLTAVTLCDCVGTLSSIASARVRCGRYKRSLERGNHKIQELDFTVLTDFLLTLSSPETDVAGETE